MHHIVPLRTAHRLPREHKPRWLAPGPFTGKTTLLRWIARWHGWTVIELSWESEEQ